MAAYAQSNLPEHGQPFDWASFFAFCDSIEIPEEFLSVSQLGRWSNRPDLFEGWEE